jgi:S-adenosylmethionine synthetase
MGVYVNTYGSAKVNLTDAQIAQKIQTIFDLRPNAIVRRLGLRNPIFSATAAYGHMGREPQTITENGKTYELFTWEKLDYVDTIKKAFGL